MATPNGQKVGIALEELGLAYEAHRINIMNDDQFDPEFIAINPNSKIPALIDPNGPDGKPIAIMESAAILIYLAEKAGKLLPTEPRLRSETLQWLFFQMGSIGPMLGQFGHFFKFARGKTDDYGVNRYSQEAKRLLAVLDQRLADHDYLVGDQYTIADIATYPWIGALDFYEGKEALDYNSLTNLTQWYDRCAERPAAKRGYKVCSID